MRISKKVLMVLIFMISLTGCTTTKEIIGTTYESMRDGVGLVQTNILDLYKKAKPESAPE